MANKGLYFKDIQLLIDQGDLTFIGDSGLMQVIRPCEVISRRPAIKRKSEPYELTEVEATVALGKGPLLAVQWRAANQAEQQKLASVSGAELKAWGMRNEKGEVRVKVLSQIKDIHAAIRQSLRHIPRNFLGQELKFKGKSLSLPGRLQVLADLGEEFLDLNASIMELATAPSAAAEEVIESLDKFSEKVSAAIKDIESLQKQGKSTPKEISAAALARLVIDLKIMEKYLRRAGKLIAYDQMLKEKMGQSYEKLMGLINKAQRSKLTSKDWAAAHGVYKALTEYIHVNPYYAERIACPELQRLSQIKGRSQKTALNYIKGAAFKLEAVALPIVQKQVLQKQAYYQRGIKEFSLEVSSFVDPSAIINKVAERIQLTFKSASIAIFLKDARSQSYIIRHKLGLDGLTEEAKFKDADGLMPLLKQKSKVWFCHEVMAKGARVTRQERKILKACQAELLVPLIVKDELVGMVSIGERPHREAYDQEAFSFLLNVCSQAALAIEGLQLRRQHKARQQELEAAREIQKTLLPGAVPQIIGCEMAALCESCLEVGGDYYDLLKFSDHRVGVIIADVVGKGAPAALLMSNLQAAVKILVTENIQPGVLVGKVNNLIHSSIPPNRYITLFYGLFDMSEKTLTYTNAGHNPPFLLKADGSHVALDKGGTVIGIIPNGRYEEESIKLESDDLLVLYTDGVTEARNGAGEEFGEVRLREQASDRKRKSVEELLQKIHQCVTTFAQGEMQDDLTLILASIR